MKTSATLIGAALLAGLASPAFAQDTAAAGAPATADPAAPAPASAPYPAAQTPDSGNPSAARAAATGFDPVFTGPRIEGFGGVDFERYNYSATPAGAVIRHTGGVAGALGGFDLGLGGVVVGVFGSYALPTSNGCANFVATSRGGCIRPEREVEAGGRVGFNYDRFLIYGKGAYVNTSTKVQSRQPNGGYFNTYRLTPGWRVGGGAEYALTNHAYAKLEYDYTSAGRFDLTPYGYPGVSYKETSNQVLGGFGIRF